MEIIIGFLLAGFGGMILYSVKTEKNKKKGSGNALIIGFIMIILGGYMVYDKFERQERIKKMEEERRRIQSTRRECPSCGGFGCKWCHYKGYIDIVPFGHSNMTCGANGCSCTIKRSELEAGEQIRCSCGHLTTWHHN